jgi:hypothetical protein
MAAKLHIGGQQHCGVSKFSISVALQQESTLQAIHLELHINPIAQRYVHIFCVHYAARLATPVNKNEIWRHPVNDRVLLRRRFVLPLFHTDLIL